jgi:hypothetical protein
MGYKIFIVLIWLSIPFCAAALLNADMKRYEAESIKQARSCRTRADQLSRSTAVLSRQALKLGDVSDGFHLRQWRRDWTSVRHEVDKELPQMASSSLSHYAATAALLQTQEDGLKKVTKAAEDAAKDWDYYLRGQEVLLELAGGIDQTRRQARFYRMLPNGRGIYLLLQEQLATLESRYQAQDQEQSRLYQKVRQRLTDADQDSRNIQHALSRVPDRMAEDEKRTYVESIRARYERFDVREALAAMLTKALAAGPQAQQAAQPQGLPPLVRTLPLNLRPLMKQTLA